MKISLRLLIGLAAVFAVVSPPSVWAQQNIVPKFEKKEIPYRLTRGDVVSISIVNEPDLTISQRKIETLGTINLVYIGDVRVVGLTIKEAQAAIEESYRENRILRNPTATVLVEQYQPRVVRISGYVNSPGQINIPPDVQMTLLEVIFKANGLQETAAGNRIRITRTKPDGTLETFVKNVEDAIKAKDKPTSGDALFVIEPDDVIYVPQKII